MYATHLECRNCGLETPLAPLYHCDACFGPLDVGYDYQAIARDVPRSEVSSGPDNLWRYQSLLPVDGSPIDLSTGWTPLLKADRLGARLGLRDLWIKNDSVNPTFSFKDRNVAVAVNKAIDFGFDTFCCASTGNLSGSVAGFAARAGLRSYVFVPADLEQAKLISASVYGTTLVTVDGNYDAVNRLCTQIADEHGWAFANINLRPYYSEGSKTLGFEIVEQLGWEAPDAIVLPMAGASLLTKTYKGLQELVKVGWVESCSTRLIGAQPEGCAPVVKALQSNSGEVLPVVPDTIARSLAIGAPADGFYALQAIRASNGYAEAATDEEIVEGIRLLASLEGIFTETAGGTVVAVADRLAQQGILHRDERVVLGITGNGLKTLEALEGQHFPLVHLQRASVSEFEDVLMADRFDGVEIASAQS